MRPGGAWLLSLSPPLGRGAQGRALGKMSGEASWGGTATESGASPEFLGPDTPLPGEAVLEAFQVTHAASSVNDDPCGPGRATTPATQGEEAEDLEVDMDKIKATPQLWTIHRDGEVLLRLSKHGPGHEAPMTIPEFLRESVNRFGTYPALASKNNDVWEYLNYNQYYEACRKAAKAFLKLGLERFQGVGFLGFNSAEWFIAALGAILAGGLCVGIYATNSAEACQYIINHSKVNILLVENDQQLQKILSIPKARMETLKSIIQYKSPIKDTGTNLYSWDDFMELGDTIPDTQLEQVMASQKANQCALLIYTSGTTGNPKGVMLSHDNITWLAGAAARDCNLCCPPVKQEVVISYLPLSHIAAQMMDLWIPIKVGGLTFFAQPDALKGSLVNTLQEVKPTAFLGVPRVWEKMQEKIKETGSKSSNLKKRVVSWAKMVGLKVNMKKMLGSHENPMSFRMAKALVFSKVRSALGFDRCHLFVSGAAPLSQDTAEFFLSLDIPIVQMYGMSESSGPHTVSTQENHKILRNKLHEQTKDGTGEVCFWGRHVFMGYLEREDATREAIDEEGWLHSGDLGRVDSQGFLYITGRIKEILITAGGENVPPVPIEDLVKEKLPIVSHAMLVGDKAKFLSMLLTLKCLTDPTSGEPLDKLTLEAASFCQKLGSQAATVSDIVGPQDPLVFAAIQRGIDAVNREATSNAQKIQKWAILEKDFSIAGGELGPTSKLKRYFVTQKYKAEIDNFYN
ncbi:long-chain-fatty-acid--CoA ligase ACSBG2 isoform X2 [Choloepus didactylus]|uniref:long-chain-fatty-acid--CoA ligase ACSBG2 isoform X2 n=1 Tax=Choloepus didactylus TaxID=27675 RepID=UPI00189D5C05|nr:long-chain-fatty-acid--CoA ligase ACSBG2 isoform X2 [Choloepus didactylus]